MLFLVFLASFSLYGIPQTTPPPILGRWDLTIHGPNGDRSAWLEVRHSGVQTLVGQFVGTSGSARPISQVEFTGGEMRFAIPPQWERIDGKLVVTGRLDGDRLTGLMTLGSGAPVSWTGVRAPTLRRETAEVDAGRCYSTRRSDRVTPRARTTGSGTAPRTARSPAATS